MTIQILKEKWTGLRTQARRYLRSTSATIVVSFALMAPVVVGAAGMSLDFARAYLVQQRLAQALDAASLAGVASSTDPDVIEQKIRDFFAVNYPPEKIGFTFDPVVTIIGSEVYVTGNAYYDTTFLRLLGINEIDVAAETIVEREVQGIEVALVLDNTGSMATNNNIGTLKEATRNFIGIMFDSTNDPQNIRIGLVPYANSVRVGSYGLGLKPDGGTYGGGTVFVNLPAGYTYTADHNHRDYEKKWFGCVIEHNPYGWDPDSSYNDPYPDDVLDEYEGPWDIYAYERYQYIGQTCSDGKCWNNYDYVPYTYPNQNCPYALITPLSSDRNALLEQVETMNAHGNTLGNIGMAWGYRVLSPEEPYTEGVPWENRNWLKAIVMMTDGNNTRDSHYSAFWRRRNNQIQVNHYNERFAETCEAMKERGVLIYTVTFYSNISDDTKSYYRECATSEAQYYDAPTTEELIDVFERISRELSNIHIKG